jgi:hypothetical protein
MYISLGVYFQAGQNRHVTFFIYNSEHIIGDNFMHVNKLKSLLGWIVA